MTALRPLALVDARIIDPATARDVAGGVLVIDGVIAAAGPEVTGAGLPEGTEIIACAGHVIAPGLIDMRVFTGEPGSEHRETLATASEAAAAGGITTIVTMPNTEPVIDEAALVDFIARRARDTAKVRVLPMAALTQGLAGETMSEMGLLLEAGAVGFTDGDRTVVNSLVMRRALAYAKNFGALVVGHCEDPWLSQGLVTEGEFAMRLGLAGMPTAAETIIVERDIRLVELTGARYHIAQVSCAASVDAVARAKARGLPVTAGVSAHHLALNMLDVGAYRTFLKVRPPLRDESDRVAVTEGVESGVIDVVVSSHDPQAADTKRLPFAQAAFGAAGLETLLPAVLQRVHDGQLSLLRAIGAVTAAPAAILGLASGRIAPGAPADLTVIDLGVPWRLDAQRLRSRAKNSPFDGRRFEGRAIRTIVGGRTVFVLEGE